MIAALLLLAVTPEQRAVDYLVREVPAWAKENRCYSCHNNGDGARALYAARIGYDVPKQALSDTTEWLRQPAAWDEGAKNPAASDLKLARLQFAVALATSQEGSALKTAEEVLVAQQEADGSWRVDTGQNAGGPVTWGTPLATAMARIVLWRAGRDFDQQCNRATEWLLRLKPASLLDAAAVTLGLGKDDPVLLKAQNNDGGWGPQIHSPSEPFDTAVIVLALDRLDTRPKAAVARGRQFLIDRQLPDGSWPETTRPPGGQSYAHRISTTSWATLALIQTDPKRK